MTKIKHIPLGFPQNITIINTIEDLDNIKSNDYSNKNVHLKISLTKLQKKNFNKDALEKEIQEATNAARVKVTFVYDLDTNIRSREVAEQTDVISKFKVYANLNGIKYRDEAVDKIQKIQDSMALESFTPHETFTLEYVSIRGAIGIMDGQHKEEISFDFLNGFNEGIIGICGSSGSGKCITGDSIILTDNGFTQINRFALPNIDGFKPLTKTLYAQKNDKAKSSHFYTEKVNKTIKIKNSLGMTLEGTPDHPVLIFNSNCEYQFKKLKDIKEGDYICVPRGMNVFPKQNKPFNRPIRKKSHNAMKRTVPTIMTEDLAKFLGYYVANGVIDGNTISFTSYNKSIIADYARCVKNVFNMDIHTSDNKNYIFNSNQIKNYLSSLFVYPLGTSHFKTIPVTILESTKECQRAFLRTYFDCDSSISRNRFELCTASKKCADMIQNMLLNFGIISVHREKKVRGYNWTYHNIVVSSLELDKLMSTIMNDSIKYNYSFDKIRNTNIDIIPYVKEYSYKFFNAQKNGMVKEDLIRYHSPCPQTTSKCVSYSFFQRYINNAKKINSPKCNEYVKKMTAIIENNYFYSPVVSVEEKNKPTIVYDFTIPSTHKFYSNGFISHNTTIIENCHPYPCMLSRVGSLKDHFCLKDSHRILIYRSSTGRRYKITMQINGTSKSIGTVYTVVYQDGDKAWEPVKSVDGTNESYVNWVESTFGNKDLFLRTSFYTNAAIKNFPDLSQATKGDKMQLFSTLAGTDFLSVFSDQAKQNVKLIEKDIDDIKGNLKDFDNIEAREKEDKKTIEEDTALLEEHKANLESDKQSLNEYNELQKAFIQCSATYDIYRQQKSDKTLELDKLHRQVVQSDNNIEGYNQHLADFDQYQSDLKWYEENMALRKELVIKEKNLREKLNNAQAEMDKKESVYNSKKDRYTDIAHIIQNNAKDIEHLSKSIPDLNGKCPVCGAPLESHKKEELEKEVKTINDKIDTLKKETAPLEEEYKELGKWIRDNSLQNFKSTLTDLSNQITDVSNDIISIDTYAEDIDIDQIKDLLNNTESKLAEESKRNAELKEAEHKLNLEILDLEDKLNNIPEDYTDKIARITRGIENTQEQIANLNAEISLLKKDLDAIKDSENLRKEIKSKIKGLQEDIKDYELIHQAFGNNGIQALELDSAAPEISDIANSILLETYGDRFQISFDTQRDTKDGRRIDDFVINVFDSENGRMKRLDLISSGEGTLIKQTLYYAFSVIRARKTGFCFKTRFLDESDSALDSELRVKYLRMIESAHKQCGAVQTILITHSQELKDIIDQKIEL